MGWKKHIEMVALDRTAAINHLDRLALVITGNRKLGSERVVIGISRHERAGVVADVSPAGGYAVGIGAAAFGTGAVGGDFHPDDVRHGRGGDIIMQQLRRRRIFRTSADKQHAKQRYDRTQKIVADFNHVRRVRWPMNIFTRQSAEIPTPCLEIHEIYASESSADFARLHLKTKRRINGLAVDPSIAWIVPYRNEPFTGVCEAPRWLVMTGPIAVLRTRRD